MDLGSTKIHPIHHGNNPSEQIQHNFNPIRSIFSHILIASFHHTLGPIIEWVYPSFPLSDNEIPLNSVKLDLPEEWSSLLPFGALPDGAHIATRPSFTIFHLPPVANWGFAQKTTFATCCYHQIPIAELKVKTPDMTRQMMQKSIVLLSREPLRGCLQDKLFAVVEAYFAERDFSHRTIICSFFDHLQIIFDPIRKIPNDLLYIGTDHAAFVHQWTARITLTLIKLLLLQRRVLFYSNNGHHLGAFQYALVSLIPHMLLHLQTCGSANLPSCDNLDPVFFRPTNCTTCYNDSNTNGSSKPITRAELAQRAAYPIPLFGKGAIFQPYLPLQQVDDVHQDRGVQSLIAGSTNALLKDDHGPLSVDVVVLCDQLPPKIEINDPDLVAALALSTPDKKWASMVDAIIAKCSPPPPSSAPITLRNASNTSSGDETSLAAADNLIRAQFEQYILGLLSALAWSNNSVSPNSTLATNAKSEKNDSELVALQRSRLNEFNPHFVSAVQATPWFNEWRAKIANGLSASPAIPSLWDTIEAAHPCTGYTLATHLQERMQNRIAALNLDEKRVALQAQLNSALEASGKLFEFSAQHVRDDPTRRGQNTRLPNLSSPSAPARARLAPSSPGIDSKQEDIVSKTMQAASRAKQVGTSFWEVASSYVTATRRAESPSNDEARRLGSNHVEPLGRGSSQRPFK